jgi:hypothetical protein
MTRCREKDADKVNRSRSEKSVFAAGDSVWTEVPRNPIGSVAGSKLEVRWYGPRPVVSRAGEHSYYVQINAKGKQKCFHRDQLKPYQEDVLTGESFPLYHIAPTKKRAQEIGEEEEDCIVDCILGQRVHRGVTQFKVKWQGFPVSEASWEPLCNFVTVTTGLQDFLLKHPELAPDDKAQWFADLVSCRSSTFFSKPVEAVVPPI